MNNPRLDPLEIHPFRRLNALLGDVKPETNEPPILFSVGEPQNQPPPLLAEVVQQNAHLWNKYPLPTGTPEFRRAVVAWLGRRYGLPAGFVDPDRHVLPVPGTREPLFMIALVAVPESKAGKRPAVLLPNPSYHVYAAAGPATGGELVPLSVTRETGFLPDLDALDRELLARTALFYLCTPANPQGAVADKAYLERAIRLAQEHDFALVVDECYAEIYNAAPPPGALEVAAAMGGMDNLVVFHSLSKRSSAPGLRSGFIAGDARIIARYSLLTGYGGTAPPLPLLAAATALWGDEAHVEANRALYRRNFDVAAEVLGDRLGFYRPDGGFYLWLDVGDGEAAAKRLWQKGGIRTLPGGYMTRPDGGRDNPGAPYIRVALVYDEEATERGLRRLAAIL